MKVLPGSSCYGAGEPAALYVFSVAEFVAQSCTLLFRRFSICRRPTDPRHRNISSRLQNAILRYSPDSESGRCALLEICATSARVLNTYAALGSADAKAHELRASGQRDGVAHNELRHRVGEHEYIRRIAAPG